MKYYYKTRNDVMSASLDDKIDRLLYLNAKSAEQSYVSAIKSSNYALNDIKEKNIKIGALVEGEAFFHEKLQYYDVIGFLVEAEEEYHGKRYKTYGFRSIYFGKCDKYAPVDFDDGSSLDPTGVFGNGFGDYVEITDILASEDEVNKCINENKIDINKYLKELNLYLAEKSQSNKQEMTHSDMEV